MFKKQSVKIQFDPERWLHSLNEFCGVCREVVSLDNSLTLCKCPLLTHQKCFIKKYASTFQPNSHIICRQCQSQIKFEAKPRIRYEYKNFFTIKIFLPFLLALFSIACFACLNYIGLYEGFFPRYMGYAISVGCLFVLLWSIRRRLKRSYYVIEDIKLMQRKKEKFQRIQNIRDLDQIENTQNADILDNQFTQRQIY